jgi:Rieske Fe-S protein
MSPTRRDFLKDCAAAGGVGAITMLGVACGSSPTSSNEGGGNQNPPPPSGPFEVDLTAYPALANDNSVVVVNNTPKGSIFVTHSGGNYYALSRVCTHQGCTVGATTPNLQCPCHGSQYNLMGSVVQGPAPQALQSWPTSVSGTTLTIDFS